jgi:hypothetical protein
MLKPMITGRRAALLLLIAVAGGCASIPVDPRPNLEIGSTRQEVVITNETGAPLTLLAPLDRPDVPVVTLASAGSHRLTFTLTLQQNTSAGREREVVLLPGSSSPLLAQSSIDLVLRARFGDGDPRELRIVTGDCIFNKAAMGGEHSLKLRGPPLEGVPALRLCNN